METENVGSFEHEQEWIQKYRAALDVASGTESRMKAVHAVFKKVARIISLGMRSILEKRATPAKAAVCKQSAKVEIVPTTMLARKRKVQSAVVKQRPARSQPSLQRRSRGKAS
jgi:hypothetical protein